MSNNTTPAPGFVSMKVPDIRAACEAAFREQNRRRKAYEAIALPILEAHAKAWRWWKPFSGPEPRRGRLLSWWDSLWPHERPSLDIPDCPRYLYEVFHAWDRRARFAADDVEIWVNVDDAALLRRYLTSVVPTWAVRDALKARPKSLNLLTVELYGDVEAAVADLTAAGEVVFDPETSLYALKVPTND